LARRSAIASARRATPNSRTSCSPRCATDSGAMSSSVRGARHRYEVRQTLAMAIARCHRHRVRLAQPFPPRRAESLLPSNSSRRTWCRLDASVSPYRQDELNRAGRSSTPGGQGAGHYQRDRPA
jgi:hypothetical protein